MAASSTDISPEPDAYLHVWVWVQGRDRTEQLVQGAPVPSVYVSHRRTDSIDVMVDCSFDVTYERMDEVPMGVLGTVAYQFFMRPGHTLYADFDGFEWIGALPDQVRRDIVNHAFTFHLIKTFVVPTGVVTLPGRFWDIMSS